MIVFYRALLRLYPAVFRDEYGDDLLAMFEEKLRTTSALSAFFSAIADVIPNAIAVHWDLLRQDLRYAARSFRNSPGFALTAILIIALGVGANTAAFSLADFTLLRPLPFPHPEQLVLLWNAVGDYAQNQASPAIYRDWKSMAKSFSGVAGYTGGAGNLTGRGNPVRLRIARVTPDLFALIGVPAQIGSVITPSNAGDGSVAVLSQQLWRSQFGSDRGVVGQTVRIDGKPFTIVGVMPSRFRFPDRDTEIWTPFVFAPDAFEDRSDSYVNVVARLKPDVTIERARAEAAALSANIKRQHPEDDPTSWIYVMKMRDLVSGRSRMLVLALCGASLCILILACANLASLLIARGMSRMRELSIRTALGAGRDRLIRQLVTESVMLAIAGGIIGIALAKSSLPLLTKLVPTTLPIEEVPSIDGRVLAFAAILVAITGIVFGIIPALRRPDSRRRRVRGTLVVIEIMGSVVLLISSGLLMRAIWQIQSVSPGFRTDGVLALNTALPLPKYGRTGERERFYHRVLDEIRALPGVQSAAYTTGLPMVRTAGLWNVEIAGRDPRANKNLASLRFITPGYFDTLRVPLIRGRAFTDGDTGDRPFVAIVSDSLAKQLWPGQDPLGRTIKLATKERTIVGVVADVRVRGLEQKSEPQVYLPSGQVEDNGIIGYIPQDLAVRASLPPEQLLPQVRRIIAAADPEQPVSSVRPLSDVVEGETAPRRVQLRLLAILSAIALLIAGVGIHGLLSFGVLQRTKELGIRRALGAQAGEIVALVLREGMQLFAIGAVTGVFVALLAGRSMSALLFGVPPSDPRTIAAAVGVCLMTALIGCTRPVLRAARVDPNKALREE